jgi:PKD repeat protein
MPTTVVPTPTSMHGVPVAAFIPSPSQGRVPLNVSFTDRSTGLPTAWRWEFGDGATSTARNPYHVYTTEGLKIVNLTVNNTFGSNTTTGYVTVGSVPFAAFSAEPRTVGAGKPVAFTDRSIGTPTAWSWTFGDGGTSTVRNPVHAYANSGHYTVRLTASYTGSSDTEQKTDYIRVVPDARFTANATTGKAPFAVKFTDTSNGTPTAWAWEFGDGASATVQHPVHVYTRSGNFTVNLTARNGYGATTLSHAAFVRVEPSRPLRIFPGSTAFPADLDGDGLYDDVNGNGRRDFADVVLFFNQMTWVAATAPVECFDCNGNGRIDFSDVVWLFNRL